MSDKEFIIPTVMFWAQQIPSIHNGGEHGLALGKAGTGLAA